MFSRNLTTKGRTRGNCIKRVFGDEKDLGKINRKERRNGN